jgi:predicted SAM-dependent methyltransferase
MRNLDKMLQRLEEVKALPTSSPGCYLHLGCGPLILDGWVNIDKYHEHQQVVQSDISKLVYENNSIDAIYSSHALEHLPYRKARAALIDWGRVLKPGGVLYLAIPDLEEIMRLMLNKEVQHEHKWEWYIYTLFGYQVDPAKYAGRRVVETYDAPDDEGQFHKCGFTEDSIEQFVNEAGMSITSLFTYDGWGTPSMFLEALKK